MAANKTGEQQQQQKQQASSATVYCRSSAQTLKGIASSIDPEVELPKEEEDQSCVQEQITYALFEGESERVEKIKTEVKENEQATPLPGYVHKYELVWFNVLAMVGLHLGAAYGAYLIGTAAHPATIVWTYLCIVMGTMGVQAGAHRLWCHKSYKANFGVRLLLAAWFILSMQNDIYEWCRDHRVHHKYSETDADPHDASKGFFFSHVGWLLVKKHPEVKRRGATLDLSDLLADPIVRFQQKYYVPLVALLWGLVPTFLPVLLWGEDPVTAFFVAVIFRYVLALNVTWCVNSWSHMFGYKPYDARQGAVESSMRHLLLGEGFHNYHHSFPWDYSASELGPADCFNICTCLIDLFHALGWAWELKKVRPEMITAKKRKTGDPVYFDRRHSRFYEWSTGALTTLSPLVLGLGLNFWFKHGSRGGALI